MGFGYTIIPYTFILYPCRSKQNAIADCHWTKFQIEELFSTIVITHVSVNVEHSFAYPLAFKLLFHTFSRFFTPPFPRRSPPSLSLDVKWLKYHGRTLANSNFLYTILPFSFILYPCKFYMSKQKSIADCHFTLVPNRWIILYNCHYTHECQCWTFFCFFTLFQVTPPHTFSFLHFTISSAFPSFTLPNKLPTYYSSISSIVLGSIST